MFGLGELPKGYNKAVHGPYDPAIFYGKKDIPLSEVLYIFFCILMSITFDYPT